MALVIADRVRETSTTTGTGTLTLGGAVAGYQTFSSGIGNGNTCYYAITLGSDWEVGLGTYTSAGATLSRDTILASSNANSAVNFGAGTKDVFVTYPAGKSVFKESGGNVALDVSSTSAALRITQTGSGNALVVEDSTNPDSTPFVVDASGTVIAGATTTYTTSGITVAPMNVASSSAGAGYALSSWVGASAGAGNFQFMKSRGASVGTHTIVVDGDSLGLVRFAGSDGTNFISAANIIGAVDGTPGTNDMPGRLVFSTTADGASTPTERFRISNFGGWGLAGANYGTSGTQAIVSNGNAAAPTWQTIVTPDATQTLTNKTLTTPVISTISNTGTLTLPTSTDTLVGRATTDTLTNKTLTSPTITTPAITDPVITGAITEDIFALTDGATVDIDPGNGSIQTLTLAGTGRTLTYTNMVNGEAVTLMINDGTAGTITTWNVTWVNNGGVNPTLSTSGYTVIVVWKVGGVVYGALVGNA